jgi:hypothetical protein
MRRSLLLLLALLSLHYLQWRLLQSLNLSTNLAAALSVLLLLAEGWLLLSGLLPLLLAWRRFSDGSAEADAAQLRWQTSSWRPQVDVLIPTCGEPLPVLERCLRACSQLTISTASSGCSMTPAGPRWQPWPSATAAVTTTGPSAATPRPATSTPVWP